MKELQVLCHIYIPVEDAVSREEAVADLYNMIEINCDNAGIYIHESKIEEIE